MAVGVQHKEQANANVVRNVLEHRWFGYLVVEAEADGVCSVRWANEAPEPYVADSNEDEQARLWADTAVLQLKEYFAGMRRAFEVPVVLRGTAFQVAVWKSLLHIPYGETRSYGDVARMIGNEKAVRAVGQANRANPVPVIVPCHRVVGSGGTLTGYAGDQVDLKQRLLEHEGAVLPKSPRAKHTLLEEQIILPLV